MPVGLFHLTKILLESTCTEYSIGKCKHQETEVILLIKGHPSYVPSRNWAIFTAVNLSPFKCIKHTFRKGKKIIIKFLLKTATAWSKTLHDLFLTFSKLQAFFSIGEINIYFNLNMLQMSKPLCKLFIS